MRSDITTAAMLVTMMTGCGPQFTMAASDETDVGIAADAGASLSPKHDASPPPHARNESSGDAGVAVDAATTAEEAVDAAPPVALDAGAFAVDDAAVDAVAVDAVAVDAAPVTVDAAVEAGPPTCDPTQPPSASACVLDEAYGVFVAPTTRGGSDVSGTGSRTQPFATIQKALASVPARVYVCDGVYVGQVAVGGAVGIFGGLTCGESSGSGTSGPWAYAPGTTATVIGSSPAFALEVDVWTGPVDIEDMTWNAAPGATPSQSSVAAFLVKSPAVTLRRNTLVAASGAAGENGVAGAPGAVVLTTVHGDAQAGLSSGGQEATASAAGGATACTCADDDVSVGGFGGDATNTYDGETGMPVQSVESANWMSGAGGTNPWCVLGVQYGVGGPGSNAEVTYGAAGLGGQNGTLEMAGWTPAPGSRGANGGVGQGGGGGGGIPAGDSRAGFGGGGGCGGCGGSGGGAGGGGGGSIALLSYDSSVTVVGSTLISGAGGNGGAGASGGAAQDGGAGGLASGGACNGGAGGNGGVGGAGGGGAGGVSFAVLFSGAPPNLDGASTLTAGSPGASGAGGDVAVNGGAMGVSGTMQDVASL